MALCSCKIQTDSNQHVKKTIKEVYAALTRQSPERFDLKKMEDNTLDCFCYLLGIKDDVKMKARIELERQSRRNKLVQIDEERNNRIYLGENQVRCPFCDIKFTLTDRE